MTDPIKSALMARLSFVDWYYEYSDDYTVWSNEKKKVDSLRTDLLKMPLEENQEMMGEAIKSNTDPNAIKFLGMIIEEQLRDRGLRESTGMPRI